MSLSKIASDTITVGLGPKYNPDIGPYVSAMYLNILGMCNPFRFRNSLGRNGMLPKTGTYFKLKYIFILSSHFYISFKNFLVDFKFLL